MKLPIKKALAKASEVLASQNPSFKEKKETLDGVLAKTKEDEKASKLFVYVIRRFTPHIVRSKDEKMAKYVLKLTENPIEELDTVGKFNFFCMRMELISQLGSKRNIKDIEREKQRVEFITEHVTKRAEKAIEKLKTAPNF